MNKLASQLPEYPVIMEMYGVGESLGPQLMAEIGDVRRFERKQSLVAFAGIDPMPQPVRRKECSQQQILKAWLSLFAKDLI